MSRRNYLYEHTLVITGVSKGIGKAVAIQALEEGMTVIGWGRNAPDYAHPKLHFISCDVSDPEQVTAAAKRTYEISSEVRFLLNNAGFGQFQQIQDFEADVFKRMWEVNVYGAFLVTQALVKGMQEQKAGHIVNVSSIAGRVGAPWGAGYNASKFGLTGLGESLFSELRKQGIKVTNVYPGSTATHFFEDIPGMDAHSNMLAVEELAASIIHVMNTSRNYLVREIEIRPLNSKPPK